MIAFAVVLGVVVAMLAAAYPARIGAGCPSSGPSISNDAMLDSGASVTEVVTPDRSPDDDRDPEARSHNGG
jgi:hypothetical protein